MYIDRHLKFVLNGGFLRRYYDTPDLEEELQFIELSEKMYTGPDFINSVSYSV